MKIRKKKEREHTDDEVKHLAVAACRCSTGGVANEEARRNCTVCLCLFLNRNVVLGKRTSTLSGTFSLHCLSA